MAEVNEKYLKPIRDICQKIIVNENVKKLVADLREYSEKGAFYEFHVFFELLEVLSQNSELSKPKTGEIFKLLNELLRNGNNKESIISRLYNFIINHKDRPDLTDELITTCSFNKKEPHSSKPDHLFYVSEMLLRYCRTNEHRQSMYRNFQLHYIEHGFDEDLCLKLLQSTNRSVSNLLLVKKSNETVEFLEETLVKSIATNVLRAPSKEAYEELFNLMSTLAKYGHNNSEMMKTGRHIADELSSLLTKDQKRCNNIFIIIFEFCSEKTISEARLKDLLSKHFKGNKDTQPENLFYEKTALLVAKLFKQKIESFELTPECFSTYHNLVINIFHVFKSIKNKSGVIACCSDIKRHEIHNLSLTVFNLAARLARAKKINKSVIHNLLYYVTYDLSICSSLKCQSKDREKIALYDRIYTVLYEFANEKSMVSENINNLDVYVKTMLTLWDDVPGNMKSTNIVPDNLIWKVYDAPTTKEGAVYSANGMLMMMNRQDYRDFVQSSKESKKSALKSMFSVRESLTLLESSTVTKFVKSKAFSCHLEHFPIAQIILIEICTISRYNSGEKLEVIAELFTELCSKTNDPRILALACQNISDEVLRKIDVNDFNKINKLLENEVSKKFDLEISLALALNNYNIFFVKSEAVTNSLKKDTKQTITSHELQEEIELLKYLNVSLQHLTDFVCHLIKIKDDINKILSMRRVLNVLNNIAIQYYIRGIKHKDLEAFSLLWNLILLEDQSNIVIVSIGTFFLDHYQILIDTSGNYIKISKKVKQPTIDEILETCNKIVDDDFMPTFKSQPSATQCSVWSYMLSLCVYYMSHGRKSDGFKRWDQFLKSWQSVKTPDESANQETVHSKIYFCMMQINMNCRNKSADNFLSIASGILMRVKKITHEFVYHFYQIYHRITMESINYSINRLSDMNHYDIVMLSLISAARKKGFFLKLLDLLSLSILRNLNMEKIDNAKNQLQEITILLGLKEEILIESPIKGASSIASPEYEYHEEKVRKVAIPPVNSMQCVLSMVYQDQSDELSNKLESFVHKSTCKCDICKIPQLKFVMFQIGCHYSRLLWLNNKFDVSMKFNQYALEPWRNVCDKLRRAKNYEFLTINKMNFVEFSIRWLFQCADTLITMKKYEDVEEIYQEVELICAINIADYLCLNEALHCRKENLNFLLKHDIREEKEVSEAQLSFDEFLKIKKPKKSPTPYVISKRLLPKVNLEVSKETDAIYVDVSDDHPVVPKIPKTVKKARSNIEETPKQATNSKSVTKSSTRKGKAAEAEPPASMRKTRRMM